MNILHAFRQPYVFLLGVAGGSLAIVLSMLMAGHDDKTPLVIAIGLGTAMITKGATSFGHGAPNTAVALFICASITISACLAIVGVAPALLAMAENGLAMALSGIVGLYSALLGAAQDRPKE